MLTTESDAGLLREVAEPLIGPREAASGPRSWIPIPLPGRQFVAPGETAASDAGSLLVWPWERVVVSVAGTLAPCALQLEVAELRPRAEAHGEELQEEGSTAARRSGGRRFGGGFGSSRSGRVVSGLRAVVAEPGLWRLERARAAEVSRMNEWLSGGVADVGLGAV